MHRGQTGLLVPVSQDIDFIASSAHLLPDKVSLDRKNTESAATHNGTCQAVRGAAIASPIPLMQEVNCIGSLIRHQSDTISHDRTCTTSSANQDGSCETVPRAENALPTPALQEPGCIEPPI